MTAVYYQDDLVTLYHGDARDVTAWLDADVLVMDPPYGRAWRQGEMKARHQRSDSRPGIAGDDDTAVRDTLLALWGTTRPAIVFGDLTLPPPAGTKLTLVYRKPPDAGLRGAIGGFRRDLEAVYLLGPWPSGIGGRTALLTTNAATVGNPVGLVARSGGHPHAKPLDLLEALLTHCPPGRVADPTAGSGPVLIAARNLGRPAIGVELEARWCLAAARRLAQGALPIPAPVTP